MGLSVRYHAVSMAAVFLALGVGVLIGVGFGDSVVSGAQRNLETSLQGDLDSARSERDDARDELKAEQQFSSSVFPLLVENRLRGERIGIVSLGPLPESVSDEITDTLEKAGGRLRSVVVLREPIDDGQVERALRSPVDAGTTEELRAFGRRVGRELATGGAALQRLSQERSLFERTSGRTGELDAVVVARSRSENLTEAEAERQDLVEKAVLEGIGERSVPSVGVETQDADPSSIGVFQAQGLSTVDNIGTAAGKVALVFALTGSEGDYGVGGKADRLLPELLLGPDEDRER
ncbi:MAG: copper transporter [Solirubrobacterales bacterium]